MSRNRRSSIGNILSTKSKSFSSDKSSNEELLSKKMTVSGSTPPNPKKALFPGFNAKHENPEGDYGKVSIHAQLTAELNKILQNPNDPGIHILHEDESRAPTSTTVFRNRVVSPGTPKRSNSCSPREGGREGVSPPKPSTISPRSGNARSTSPNRLSARTPRVAISAISANSAPSADIKRAAVEEPTNVTTTSTGPPRPPPRKLSLTGQPVTARTLSKDGPVSQSPPTAASGTPGTPGASRNQISGHNTTLPTAPTIWELAATGKLAGVHHLLEQSKKDLDAIGPDGNTPLIRAVIGNHPPVVDYLIKVNANVNTASTKGLNAFHCACEQGNLELAKLLSEHIPDPNCLNTITGRTALHYAVASKSVKLVEWLLNLGVDVNVRTNYGISPITIAVSIGSEPIVRILLQRKADPNSEGFEGHTLLHMATLYGFYRVAGLLLRSGANINAKNKEGIAPLSLLASQTANVTLGGIGGDGQNPITEFIHWIFLCSCANDDDNMVKAILRVVPQYFPLQRVGDTFASISPLSVAIGLQSYNVAICLIENGAPVKVPLENLPFAIFDTGHEALLKALCKALLASQGSKKKKKLDLSSCNLATLSETFVRIFIKLCTESDDDTIRNIKVIDLSHNLLRSVPPNLLDVPQLEKVKLEGNPLDTVPDTFKKTFSWVKIREYLKTVRDRSAQWKMTKLLIVGQEGVGKTTLVRSLQSKHGKSSCKQNIATNGIEIKRFSLGEDDDVNLSVWDLGGQEVFYPTHQFYLTGNCSVYFIVFDMAVVMNRESLGNAAYEEIESRISYWAYQIRELTAGCRKTPIFLIGTHLDQITMKNKEKAISDQLDVLRNKFPRQRFPNLVGIYTVSCKTGEGIQELRQDVIHVIKQKDFLPVVAESWVKLYDYIQQIRAVSSDNLETISRSTLNQWALMCGVERQHIQLACEFLRDVGVILIYQFDGLDDLVVLDPKWLSNIMTSLITFRHSWIKSGTLPMQDVPQVFDVYPPEIHDTLLALLEKFSIILKVQTGQKQEILVPSLLPETAPALLMQEWPKVQSTNQNGSNIPGVIREEYGRVYRFPFLPLGFFGRLMVRVLHLPNVRGVIYWRSGMVLEYLAPAILQKTPRGNNPAPTTTSSLFQGLNNANNNLSNPDKQLALLEYDSVHFQFSIRVRTPKEVLATSSLLQMMIDAVDTILEEYCMREMAERLIPCTHCIQLQNGGTKVATPPQPPSRASGRGSPMPSLSGSSWSSTSSLRSTSQTSPSQLATNNSSNNSSPTSSTSSLLLGDADVEQTIFMFSYAECVKAVTEQQGIVFCNHIRSPSRMVAVDVLAPDIALSGIPLIDDKQLIIFEQIGKGGFGTVYRGELQQITETGRYEPSQQRRRKSSKNMFKVDPTESGKARLAFPVAVKELACEETESAEMMSTMYSDFQQEVYIMSRINHHPNIVRLHGVCLFPKPRMILELLSKGDLHGFLHPKDPNQPDNLQTFIPAATFPWRLRMMIALDIAKGMSVLHNQQPPIVHRDLRSPNIFLSSTDMNSSVRAKVADFGLARVVAPTVGGTLNTWQWLAPEVLGMFQQPRNTTLPPAAPSSPNNWKGLPVKTTTSMYGTPSDVYSFGICCWEIATGGFPFDEFNDDPRFQGKVSLIKQAILLEHLRPSLPPAAHLGQDAVEGRTAPRLFLDMIERCWQTEASKRPTFTQITSELSDLLQLNTPQQILQTKVVQGHLLVPNHPALNRNSSRISIDFLPVEFQNIMKERQASIVYHSEYKKVVQNKIQAPANAIAPSMSSTSSSNSSAVAAMADRKRRSSLSSPFSLTPSVSSPSATIAAALGAPSPAFAPILSTQLTSAAISDVAGETEIWIGSSNGWLIVVDAASLKPSKQWKAHGDPVLATICNSNDTMWTCTHSGQISVWDCQQKILIQEWNFRKRTIQCAALIRTTGDQHQVWIASSFVIQMYSESRQLIHILQVSKKLPILSIGQHADKVWVGSIDQITLYDAETLDFLGSWEAHKGDVISIASAGSSVWTGSSSGQICIWDVNNLDIVCKTKLQVNSACLQIYFSPVENRVWTVFADSVIVWDALTGKPLQEITDMKDTVCICNSMNLDQLYSIQKDGSAQSWEFIGK